MKKIPVTVITGFLGAGKTTLISELLEQADGRKIALLINEFGSLGIDADLVKGCGIQGCSEEDIVELANGCICCTVAEDFLPAMQYLLERENRPDHIVIETSGLALPQPLIRAFNWPDIRHAVTVDSVITVVDGWAVHEGRVAFDEKAVDRQREQDESLDHEKPLTELFEDQLHSADLVILSKTDLLDDAQKTVAIGNIEAKLRPGVTILQKGGNAVPLEVLLGLEKAAESDLANRHEIHHHHHEMEGHADDHDHVHRLEHDHGHDEFDSFIIEIPEIEDAKNFEAALQAIVSNHRLLRVKGFATVKGKPMRLVIQSAGTRVTSYFDQIANGEDRVCRFVVIGFSGLDREAISNDLLNHQRLIAA